MKRKPFTPPPSLLWKFSAEVFSDLEHLDWHLWHDGLLPVWLPPRPVLLSHSDDEGSGSAVLALMNSSHGLPSCQSLLFSHNAQLIAVSCSKGSGVAPRSATLPPRPHEEAASPRFPTKPQGNLTSNFSQESRQRATCFFPLSLTLKAFIRSDRPHLHIWGFLCGTGERCA